MIAPPWVPVPPVAYGGTELMIDLLCRGLLDAGHEVTLFASGDSKCPVPMQSYFDKAVDFVANGALFEMRHVFAAYEAFADYDVIHDHTMIGPLSWRSDRMPPVVTTNHGPFQQDTMEFWEQLSKRNVSIIAISRNQASQATPGIKIDQVIHHGLNPDDFTVGAGNGGYFASLGRTVPEKGIHTACELAKEAGVPLKIAAKSREPFEKEFFEQAIRPLLSKDIEYLGELNKADTQQFLREAKALLNPIAWAEPFGLVMTEAFAVGTPVIASRCGSVPEIVTEGKTGYICKSKEEFLTAINNIDQIDRGQCRNEIETVFSVANMTAKHLAVYEQASIEMNRTPQTIKTLSKASLTKRTLK